IKALDIAFDSFQREFVLGKKRIIVPATAVTGVVDPETGNFVRYFDADDEVYQAMELGGGDSDKIVDTSVELRVEEHVGAINALLKILSTQMGLNAGAFTFDGTGIKTATEVVSEQSETFRTKQDHENNAEQAIRELVTAIYELGYTFDLVSKIEDFDVVVTFDDSIIEDKQAEVDRQILLLTNNLTTKVKALMKVHGITEEEAIRL
ncbi:phage portal protein, partial [Streptococcus pneumoniae]